VTIERQNVTITSILRTAPISALVVLCLASFAQASDGVSDQPASNRAGPIPFQVPQGFEIELVASPPLVERPMMASFDDRGRLFVCDSSGFNLLKGSSEILVKDPPHAIHCSSLWR
jgi:hypothetical protein